MCLVFCVHRLQCFSFTNSGFHGKLLCLILFGKFPNQISMTPEVVAEKKCLSKQLTDSDVSITNVFGRLFSYKIYNALENLT